MVAIIIYKVYVLHGCAKYFMFFLLISKNKIKFATK